jgi:hypothetical protein
MKLRNVWLFTIFSALTTVAPVAAQVTPADSAAVLLGVARSLRAEGRTALANSLLTLIIERYAATPAATEAQQLREGLRNVQDERSGRTELLVWSTSYGLMLGALTPVAFEADSEEAVGFGLLVGGPIGYAAGRAMLGERDLSEGQARAISFGSFWGAWQGFGWANVLDIGEREVCTDFGGGCFRQDPSGETLLRSAIVGSIMGIGTGLYLARKDIPAGTATTVNFGALWGTWYGGALYFLVDGDGSDEDNGLAATLMGGNVGLAAMAVMAPKWQLSRGRARLISISGVAGLLGGLGILLISGAEGQGSILVPLAGSTLGLAAGVGWTRNYDEQMRTRGGDSELSSALHWQNGKLQLALPELTLQSLETRRAGKPAYEPAVRIPLFSAKF